MNKEEAEMYTKQDGVDIPQLLDGLLKLGPKIAIVTDAANGSYATDGETAWHLGTRPEIPRVEATGAGDAFSSAFAVSLLLGNDIPEAMRWGTFNAESVIQKIGPQAGILRKKELEDELRRNPDFKARVL
jgi:sugar/nucleoside kinase (ribokinase family)